jgi:excisionase family DNA binding protein
MSAKNSLSAKRVKLGPAHADGVLASESDSSERLTVSIERAARILGISRAAAYVYAKDGRLPVIRLGSRVLVPKAALDKLFTVA